MFKLFRGTSPNFHQIGRSNFFNVERPHKYALLPSLLQVPDQLRNSSTPGEVLSTSDPSPSFTIDPTCVQFITSLRHHLYYFHRSAASQPSILTNSVPTVIVAPVSTSTQSESLSTPLIVGVAVGGSTLVIGGITLFVIIQRRRRSTKARETFIFNRELMFQRQPRAYDAWTLRSVDLEKGIRGSSPQIFVTTTTTRDTDY